MDAKQSGGDPFAAIETVMPSEEFTASVTEAQKLAQPEIFDFLHRIGESYATLRRYAPEILDVLRTALHAHADPLMILSVGCGPGPFAFYRRLPHRGDS